MIAVIKYDGTVCQPCLFEFPEDLPYPGIHFLDFVIILRPIMLHFGGPRMIRRDGNSFGIVAEFFDRLVKRTFMGNPYVEHGEKRLSGSAILVSCGVAGFVPGLWLVNGIVILFGIVGSIIPGLPQIVGEKANLRRNWIGASHIFRPHGSGIYPRDQRGPRRGAYRGGGKGIFIQHPLACEPVDNRRCRKLIPIRADKLAVVLAYNPEDVGWFEKRFCFSSCKQIYHESANTKLSLNHPL